jgi:hypothetical protein
MDNRVKRRARPLAIVLSLVIGGCSDREATTDARSRDIPSPPATDRWLGRWIGPEGTFLLLEGGNGTYEVTIQVLPRLTAGPRWNVPVAA